MATSIEFARMYPTGITPTDFCKSIAAPLELKKRHKKYALATMCVGVGQGYALILENIDRA